MVNFIPYINIHSYIHFSIQVHKKHTYIHTYIHTDRQTKIMYIFRLPGIVYIHTYIHTYIHNITYIPSSLRMVGINTFLTVSLSLQSLYHACVDQLASEADVEAVHSFIHSLSTYIRTYKQNVRYLDRG